MAGVFGSHMAVSQTKARSSLNSAALSRTKLKRFREPHSSSPSIMMVIGSGSLPVTALIGAAGLDEGHGLAFVVAGAAQHDDFPPTGNVSRRGSKGGVFHWLSGSTGWTS